MLHSSNLQKAVGLVFWRISSRPWYVSYACVYIIKSSKIWFIDIHDSMNKHGFVCVSCLLRL
jgi:hypothetical protein